MSKKAKQPNSLWSSLNLVIVFCWILPLLVILTIFATQSNQAVKSQVESTITTSVYNALNLIEKQVVQAMDDSRSATYDYTLSNVYSDYQSHGDYLQLYDETTRYLTSQYAHNDLFDTTYLMYHSLPDNVFYTAGAGEQDSAKMLRNFTLYVLPEVEELALTLDTKIGFLEYEGYLYMVRNLVDGNFQPFAILVMACDAANMASSVEGIVWGQDVLVQVDDQVLYQLGEESFSQLDELTYQRETEVYEMGVQSKVEGHTIQLQVRMGAEFLHAEQAQIYLLLAILVPSCLLLLALIVFVIHRKVAGPVRHLVEATNRLAQGELGYHMKEETSSKEFYALSQQVNLVSDNLKELFDRNIEEQIALHEAKIKALQSQINPHFLNNTLELINWEARMADNEKVSHMIESLSVMLDAAMARGGSTVVELRAELTYVEAYLYIIAQRFGDRFTLIQEMDSSLLGIKVPRLILQPIVENAINHGIAQRTKGEMILRLTEEGDYYYLDVEHDGHISQSDRERIDALLTWNPEDKIESELGRIGIRNVNLRLKMLCGTEGGLTITTPEEGRVLSRITLTKELM